MKFQAVKGTRDFYPEQLAVLNALFDAWRRVSRRNGFVEYDGPILEHLELLTAKSGEEIVGQLFSLTDRAGRALALRPEMTPTLARMINARAQSLPRPIKWFSIPRCFRAERPQRGRLREFFQWNIDLVGEKSALADAETIFVAVDLLRELGLGSDDVIVRISNRTLLAGLLEHVGIPADQQNDAFTLLDRAVKLPTEAATRQWNDRFATWIDYERLTELFACPHPDELIALLDKTGVHSDGIATAAERLQETFSVLGKLGVSDYCRFDLRIVRGLAYYTGTVFEVLDAAGSMRAICGGGRYDDLLSALGGPDLPAIGFGMGDVVLANLLEEKNKLPQPDEALDAFLIDAVPQLFPNLLELAATLRQRGIGCAFSYRRQAVGKQLREASNLDARFAVILGEETLQQNLLSVKNLKTGEQTEHPFTAFKEDPHIILASSR